MTTVHVIYRHEPDGWWAESPDLVGWSVAGATFGEVRQLACEGVAFALGHDAVVEHQAAAGERLPA